MVRLWKAKNPKKETVMSQRKIFAILLCIVSLLFTLGMTPPTPASATTPVSTHWYSPIFELGPKAIAFYSCVIYRESRSTWNHPKTHDGDAAYPGQFGLFQFVWPSKNNIWDAYIYPILHVEPRYASAFEQSEGAAILWKMGDAVHNWAPYDGC
jgi:hypothetical protein